MSPIIIIYFPREYKEKKDNTSNYCINYAYNIAVLGLNLSFYYDNFPYLPNCLLNFERDECKIYYNNLNQDNSITNLMCVGVKRIELLKNICGNKIKNYEDYTIFPFLNNLESVYIREGAPIICNNLLYGLSSFYLTGKNRQAFVSVPHFRYWLEKVALEITND